MSYRIYPLLTTHYSLSSLTTHRSLLTAHFSPLTSRHSLLISSSSQSTAVLSHQPSLTRRAETRPTAVHRHRERNEMKRSEISHSKIASSDKKPRNRNDDCFKQFSPLNLEPHTRNALLSVFTVTCPTKQPHKNVIDYKKNHMFVYCKTMYWKWNLFLNKVINE